MEKIKRRINQLLLLVKYYFVLIISFFINTDNNIWLISERGDEARDNGYYFYKYLKENKKQKCIVKYVIAKNSPDIGRINQNDIVYYQSFKHILYYIKAKYLISTHIQGYSPEFRLFSRLSKYNIFYKKGKEIMLQHGIIQNFMESLVYKKNKSLDLFICGAKPEYDFFLKNFGYDETIVKYTGLARYDTLKKTKKSKKILLMPTWRTYLFGVSKEKFINSEFYKFYNKLLNDEKIIQELKNNKLELIFYPHYEIQKYINNFEVKNSRIKLGTKEKYDIQELLIQCDFLITDYSSINFDFAYMGKPLIYTQFDQNTFFEKHYQKGYFDYETKGFGPVLTNYEDTVSEIIQSIKNDFKVDHKYLKRIQEFFVYNDNNNCERIYNEIIKL